jgi:hypothetical protein
MKSRGLFKKGNGKMGGRKKGVPNRIPREMVEAIFEGIAASGYNKHGRDGVAGYVKRICDEDVVRGAALLTALVPRQLQPEPRKHHIEEQRSVMDMRAELIAKGVPAGFIDTLLAPPPIDDEYSGEFGAVDPDMADPDDDESTPK